MAEASVIKWSLSCFIFDKIAFPGSCIEEVDTFEYEVELIKETSPPE